MVVKAPSPNHWPRREHLSFRIFREKIIGVGNVCLGLTLEACFPVTKLEIGQMISIKRTG